MSDKHDVHSAARISATLRTLLAGFRQGGDKAVPVLIAEHDGGEPTAVLLPYDLFQQLIQHLDDEEEHALAELVDERLPQAPVPGQGLDTDALARIVEAGQAEASVKPAQPGTDAREH
ncbi:hypothetical protein AB0M29_35005 [Streptomyces sp. NPDC051976]|uniref:hypothetical protein n=1 Tax=Streptomyces sp. NPDC051976 TaxID=3154947 RepID=UPI003449C7AE